MGMPLKKRAAGKSQIKTLLGVGLARVFNLPYCGRSVVFLKFGLSTPQVVTMGRGPMITWPG